MDHNHFDDYLASKGWFYDNGWGYNGEYFSPSYASEFVGKSGKKCSLQMLREGDTNGRTIILHKNGTRQDKIWEGLIFTTQDVDALMRTLFELL